MPKSASPETTASGGWAAAVKSLIARSRPASLNQPFSCAMNTGPDEDSRSSATDALDRSSARAARTNGAAATPASAARRVKPLPNNARLPFFRRASLLSSRGEAERSGLRLKDPSFLADAPEHRDRRGPGGHLD